MSISYYNMSQFSIIDNKILVFINILLSRLFVTDNRSYDDRILNRVQDYFFILTRFGSVFCMYHVKILMILDKLSYKQ